LFGTFCDSRATGKTATGDAREGKLTALTASLAEADPGCCRATPDRDE